VTVSGDRQNTLVARFDPRGNAIGFLRLAFAVTVIVSHIWPLGGYGPDPGRADNNLGILAVEGFFALSGFLITRSASRAPSVGRFLWHRCLRIFPGFWVSLVVVAAMAAAITGANSWGFIWNNLTLHMGQTGIATRSRATRAQGCGTVRFTRSSLSSCATWPWRRWLWQNCCGRLCCWL
jgi:peptidoglycan/LPS O-acetylase OafA/YrhL